MVWSRSQCIKDETAIIIGSTMVVAQNLVKILNGCKHRINVVGMISELGILDLLEDTAKCYNCAGVSLLKQEEHHYWSIIFCLARGCIVKCKLVLLQQEVGVSLDCQAVLNDVDNDTAVNLKVELLLVIIIVARIESPHCERCLRNWHSGSERCVVLRDSSLLKVLKSHLLILIEQVCRFLDRAIEIVFNWHFRDDVSHQSFTGQEITMNRLRVSLCQVESVGFGETLSLLNESTISKFRSWIEIAGVRISFPNFCDDGSWWSNRWNCQRVCARINASHL